MTIIKDQYFDGERPLYESRGCGWRREIDGAKEAARGTRCDKLTIVTRDRKETIEEDGYRIEVVGIEEWLAH